MGRLHKRLSALEGAAGSTGLDHLTDDELTVRLIDVCNRLEVDGCGMPDDWRGMIERGEFAKLLAVPCET